MAPLAPGKQVTGRKLPYCAFMRPLHGETQMGSRLVRVGGCVLSLGRRGRGTRCVGSVWDDDDAGEVKGESTVGSKALMALLLSNTTPSGRPLGIRISGYQLCGLGWLQAGPCVACLWSTFFDR